MNTDFSNLFSPLLWTGKALKLLDQRRLPDREIWIECSSYEDVAVSIRDMVVRGAPAIGVVAAFGMVLGAMSGVPLDRVSEVLSATRPTAVNLFWAVQRMRTVWEHTGGDVESLEKEALSILAEDIEANRKIGELGAEEIPTARCIMTICNAGALATAGYGTALGVIRAIRERGNDVMVLAPETRPYLQGARLTAWELVRENIDVTVISDNMVGWCMKNYEIDAVVVGADRIAANGDTANKIGTYQMAVLASRHRIPFYVAAPMSTVDLALESGDLIPIEERPHEELAMIMGQVVTPRGAKLWNPSFDVTPADYIKAIITEKRIVRPPYCDNFSVGT